MSMLYMLVVYGSKTSDARKSPQEGLMQAMDDYNDALVEAGVRVMAKGLHPTSEAIRYAFKKPGEKPEVTHGPFEDSPNHISGFILIDVNSKEEAVSWASKMPDPIGYGEGLIELRQVF